MYPKKIIPLKHLWDTNRANKHFKQKQQEKQKQK